MAHSDNSLAIVVQDIKTGEPLGGAVIYLDGAFKGTTSPQEAGGTLQLHDIKNGTHTMRITLMGYRDEYIKLLIPDEKKVEVMMNKGFLYSLNRDDHYAKGINIIFIPSSTTFNCTENKKVPVSTYTKNESRFREDVLQIINRTFLNLDRITSPLVPLPAQYQDRFNFYYYYNPKFFADAFSGCAGTVPDAYWNDVTFGDITVILYPAYYGTYSNTACLPAGCYKASGPGRRLMKTPADKELLFTHETGHAVFGLVDTYCGTTYYFENFPHPNVWSSYDKCREDAMADKRNSTNCRQIEQKSPITCSKQFWRWDPDPDIMQNVFSGTFGAASTQRISYILDNAWSGSP
ncbi:MAG: carboxypeptidase-like regulatory domain-containing protein [Methanoregula sp.]|nr:MAG: carboxypeptidase-like regulatory domain-containing protein [Methanoregula sp.]